MMLSPAPLGAGSRSRSVTPTPMAMKAQTSLPRINTQGALWGEVDDDTSTPRNFGEDDLTPRDRGVAWNGIQYLGHVLGGLGIDDLDELKSLRDAVDARCRELEEEAKRASQAAGNRLPDIPFVENNEGQHLKLSGKLGEWDVGSRELGAGRYAKVFNAKHRPTGRAEAVKIIAKKELTSEEDWVNAFNEHKALSKLGQHPNLSWYSGALQCEERIYFFMAFAKGKELFDFIKLRQQNKSQVPQGAVVQVFKNITSALAHCHQRDICHRDLKPENIVIQQDYTAKLVDFGCACPRLELDACVTQCVGSMPFISPEFLCGTATDGAPADVWSLGIVLLEMIHGLRALSKGMEWESTEVSTEDCGAQLLTCFADPVQGLAQVRAKIGNTTPFAGDEVLVGMLHADPEKRPTAEVLSKAPLIA